MNEWQSAERREGRPLYVHHAGGTGSGEHRVRMNGGGGGEEEKGGGGGGALVSPPLTSSFGEVEVWRPDAPRREADVELAVSLRGW